MNKEEEMIDKKVQEQFTNCNDSIKAINEDIGVIMIAHRIEPDNKETMYQNCKINGDIDAAQAVKTIIDASIDSYIKNKEFKAANKTIAAILQAIMANLLKLKKADQKAQSEPEAEAEPEPEPEEQKADHKGIIDAGRLSEELDGLRKHFNKKHISQGDILVVLSHYRQLQEMDMMNQYSKAMSKQ